MTLSFQQRRVYDAIAQMIESSGYSPSVREIGQTTGLSSSSTVYSHLRALKKAGFIDWNPYSPRTIRLTGLSPDGEAA